MYVLVTYKSVMIIFDYDKYKDYNAKYNLEKKNYHWRGTPSYVLQIWSVVYFKNEVVLKRCSKLKGHGLNIFSAIEIMVKTINILNGKNIYCFWSKKWLYIKKIKLYTH